MRLDQAFKKAGFLLTGASNQNSELLITLRVPSEEIVVRRWRQWLEDILVLAERKSVQGLDSGGWDLDVSKRIFSDHGVVKQQWRIVVRGNLEAAQSTMVQCCINSLRTGVELDSIELYGNRAFVPDLKNGKFKGTYTSQSQLDSAVSMIAATGSGT